MANLFLWNVRVYTCWSLLFLTGDGILEKPTVWRSKQEVKARVAASALRGSGTMFSPGRSPYITSKSGEKSLQLQTQTEIGVSIQSQCMGSPLPQHCQTLIPTKALTVSRKVMWDRVEPERVSTFSIGWVIQKDKLNYKEKARHHIVVIFPFPITWATQEEVEISYRK